MYRPVEITTCGVPARASDPPGERPAGRLDPVFTHHLYEYKKGLRRLVLHTLPLDELPAVLTKLARSGVACEIAPVGNGRANVFFGDEVCVSIIRCIGKECLTDYSAEEDFILGTMLGYCRRRQCERYLRMKRQVRSRPESTKPATFGKT